MCPAETPAEDAKLDGIGLKTLLDGSSDRGAVQAQYRTAETAIYTTVTNDWKYAYSAPDRREFLFDRRHDPAESRNAADDDATQAMLETLRLQTINWLREGGEEAACDGDQWKCYPRLEVPEDPDVGLITQDRRGYVLDLPGYTDA